MAALRMLVLLVPALLAVGCSDAFVTADCEGALEVVVKGDVRGLVVDVESKEVRGGIDRERFWLSFPDPLEGIDDTAGDWLLELGFNPMGGHSILDPNLQDKMLLWYAVSSTFQIETKDAGELCEVERGTLCGRFGIDPNRDGTLSTHETDAERIHRLDSGTITFSELRREAWRASFEVVVSHDEKKETTLGGPLGGCFRTVPHLGRDGRSEFQ